MSQKQEETPKFTEEFRSSIVDFAKDLVTTFPEYSSFLTKWTLKETSDEEFQKLFEYSLKVYPERFFDILNQDVSLFSKESEINVSFFPGLSFKMIYNCEGVSDKTRETIWKYLQVILLILVKSMQDKMNFGEAMDMFNKIDVSELQGQLENAMANISKFFDDFESENATESQKADKDDSKEETPQSEDNGKRNIPNMEDIRDHLQFLFNGKIGKLAKELADDMGNDLAATFGEDLDNVNSTSDVLSALMKNPEKMGNVVKTVKDKLANKMESGDITKDELVKEASEMMSKMQGLGENLGGMAGMGNLFKDMAKSMGMNIPKGARLNTGAMKDAEKRASLKERLKSRALAKKQQEIVKQLEEEAVRIQREQEYQKFMEENPDLEKTIFSLEGDKQEKSAARDPNVLSASQKKRMKKKARKEARTVKKESSETA
tara:strand:- start:8160 stop:9458 length:1299 start_codon:yes stop_codon:yes gene_type:complete